MKHVREIATLLAIALVFEGCEKQSGCTDLSAENYNPDAQIDDGSCWYAQIDDGSCWSCGDAAQYHGYEYSTVQIGDQCWFAENLRNKNYRNGDPIPINLNDSVWSGCIDIIGYDTLWIVPPDIFALIPVAGLTCIESYSAVFGDSESECVDNSPEGLACFPSWSLNEYGRLYNWYAVDDPRGLCPSGWRVPTDEDWMTMEMALGMSQMDVIAYGPRGNDQGLQLQSEVGWIEPYNGWNFSGFSALPGGYRLNSGGCREAGSVGTWWTSSWDSTEGGAIARQIAPAGSNTNGEPMLGTVNRFPQQRTYGFSVRCIKE